MSSALVELAALLAPGDAKVAAAVELAATDPAAYVARYAARLRERAIDRVRPDLAWIALIDALGLAKRLAEIDHRAAYEDVTFAINRLTSLPKLRARWSKLGKPDDLDELPAEELLELLGRQLATEGRALVQLDMRSDAYPVVVVAADEVERVVALAKAAKLGKAIPITGAKLAKLARERERALAAAPTPPADPEAQRQFVAPTGKQVWATWGSNWHVASDGKQRYAVHWAGVEDGKQIFLSAAERDADRERRIAEKLAAGWREISQREYAKLSK